MEEIVIADFLIVLYVFVRVLSMFVAAPVFSNASIPALGKIFLAMVIAYITFLTINKTNLVLDVNLYSIVFNVIKEIITGYLMGFMLNFVFMAISYAGHFIGFNMGLMFAEVLNPFEETSGNIMGDVVYYGAMMIFILINGHHYLIQGVVASFSVVPIGKYAITQPLIDLLIKYSLSVFTIAIKISSPILVSFFLIHIAEGIIARVIPNIQVFFITQPLKIGVGLILMASLIPIYMYMIKILLQGYQDKLTEIINAMSV